MTIKQSFEGNWKFHDILKVLGCQICITVQLQGWPLKNGQGKL